MIVLVQKDLTFAVPLTTSSSNIDEKSSVFLRLMKLQNNLSWKFHFKTQVIFGKKLNTGIYMHLLFFSVYIILQSQYLIGVYLRHYQTSVMKLF